MRKLSLFLFITTFLICTSLAKVTSVSADVTFGGDDNQVLDSSSFLAYKKLALLGSIGDLVSSGVDEIDISDVSNVDSLLDSILENLASGLADDNPVSNFGLGVWESLNEFNQFLSDKAYDLANSFEYYAYPDFSSLINAITGTKVEYKQNPLVIDHFKALSNVSSEDSSPQPLPDYSFLSQTSDWLWANNNQGLYTFSSGLPINIPNRPLRYPQSSWSYISYTDNSTSGASFGSLIIVPRSFGSIYISDTGSSVSLRYEGFTYLVHQGNPDNYYYYRYMQSSVSSTALNSSTENLNSTTNRSYPPAYTWRTSFDGLGVACNYIYRNFRHVDIYYNGDPWVLASADSVPTPKFDISGLLKLYNSDRPVTYYYPSGTQIDYNALYKVILHAIQNGTPVNQTTINEGNVYYDSHDTVYSPTIYNYYSTSEDEKDFIDDILNLATIPNFDTALVEPLAEPMTNAAAVFGAGVSVFPRDILFVVGAGFVLVLFGALINRLIE